MRSTVAVCLDGQAAGAALRAQDPASKQRLAQGRVARMVAVRVRLLEDGARDCPCAGPPPRETSEKVWALVLNSLSTGWPRHCFRRSTICSSTARSVKGGERQ